MGMTSWEWEGMGTGMTSRELEGMGTAEVIPAHLYLQSVRHVEDSVTNWLDTAATEMK